MTGMPIQEVLPGRVVEFFESKEILCGVCLSVKNMRLHVLSQQNRELNLAQSRLIHTGNQPLDLGMSRHELVQKLLTIAAQRKRLKEEINLEELWSLMAGEDEGFTAKELVEFFFTGSVTDDHIAAMQRCLFQERLFFQFKDGKFFAFSREKVEQRRLELEREKERELQLEHGSRWLDAVWNKKWSGVLSELQLKLIESLKDFCLYGQDSSVSAFVKELLKKASIPPQPQSAFRLLVRLGIWREDENLYLYEQGIPVEFPESVREIAASFSTKQAKIHWDESQRKDLRKLEAITIDNALSRDFDDAISLRRLENGLYEVGIHIADVAEFVGEGTLLDKEAGRRASSIYLPDARISMFPAALSEDLFSLRAGLDRLSLSFLMHFDESGTLHHEEIVPAVVKVHHQLTYQEVNTRIKTDPVLERLYELAMKFREQRLAQGAIILPLPEINVYVNDAGMIQLSRYEKETPSQIMVSEWMIAANAMAARYLAEKGVPAIFRVQGECKQEREFIQSEHELFHIYRQRRLFSRAELETTPQPHCSLGLIQYTTVTSPIRRYVDLVVQRQLKHVLLKGEALYTEDALRQIITEIGATQARIFFVQRKWNRYWLLKYLEQEDIQTLDALVLTQNGRFAHVLLTDYLLETNVPIAQKDQARPGSLVRVKIEKLNPREDILRVQILS